MPLVWDDPQRVADWVGDRCGVPAPTVDVAIGYEQDGQLTAGIYFDGMLPNTAFAHIANAAEIMPRGLLQAACAYAFRQVGVERLTFMVDDLNFEVVDFVVRLGAKEEARLLRAFGDGDALIYTFWRDCKWAKRLLGEN